MAAEIDSRTWFAAQIRPNQLAIAERNLIRQGYSIFCPKQRQTKRRGGQFIHQLSPLFVGYLFVGVTRESCAPSAIDGTRGVTRLIRTTRDAPAPVPPSFIRMLADRCDQDGVLTNVAPLQSGDAVRLVRGPFADFVATIEHIGPQQRLWVLLDLMGREARINVDASDVQLCA